MRRFSESWLWNKQKDYYEHQGENAWQSVPHVVTNNRFVARRYAQLLDHIAPKAPTIEVGSGIGEFAFHFHQASTRPYWLTEASNSLSLALKQRLQPYLPHCHFQQLDANDYQPWLSDHQPVFIANYVLDSLAHEAYQQIDPGVFQAGRYPETTDWDSTNMCYDLTPHSDHLGYLQTLSPDIHYTLIPTGAIAFLQRLRRAHPTAWVLLSDKGLTRQDLGDVQSHLTLQMEGAASCSVNFDALEHILQPDFFAISDIIGQLDLNIRTVLLGWGLSADDKERAHTAFARYQEKSIYDYALTCRECLANSSQLSYPYLRYLLQRFDHDPHLFYHMTPKLHSHAINQQAGIHTDLTGLCQQVEVFFFPSNKRLLPAIADCYRALNQLDASQRLLDKHRHYFGTDFLYCREQACLLWLQQDHQQAKHFAQQAFALNPHCPLTQKLLQQLT